MLHQLLQWHHMLTHTEAGGAKTVPSLELNTLADWVFHGAMWVLVAASAILTVRAGPPAWDLGFLALSVVLAAAGWVLYRRAASTPRRRT